MVPESGVEISKESGAIIPAHSGRIALETI